MEFRILGPLQVVDGDRELELGRGRQRMLLALLIVHANEVVATERLIDGLWGERPPDTANKVLQGHVSQLRKALGPNVLLTRPPGYVLQVDPDDVDALRFERLVREARRAEPAAAADALAGALALWRGEALAEFAYDEFARQPSAHLDELRLAAQEERVEAELELGRHRDLIGELENLVARHPTRERLRAALMLALYRSGRQADALEAYRDARRLLVEELGIEPSEELRRLQRDMLAHAPALQAPSRTTRPARDPGGERRSARPSGSRRPAAWAAGALLLAGTATVVAVDRVRGGAHDVSVLPNSIAVIDPATNRVVADIQVGARPAALTAAGGSIWCANAGDGTVSIVDARSRRALKSVGTGAPSIDAASTPDAVWVANGSAGTVSRISVPDRTLVRTITLPGRDPVVATTAYGVAAYAGAIWVAAGPRRVLRIDPRTGTILREIPVGNTPVGIAAGLGAIWVVTTDERAWRIEPRTNEVTAHVTVPTPVAVAVGQGAVWVADSRGSVWRVDPQTADVTDTTRVARTSPVPVPAGISTGAGAVWVANADGTVSRISPQPNRVVKTIRLGHLPSDVVVAGGYVWVSIESASAT